MCIEGEDGKSSCEKETERQFGVSERPSSWLMLESLIVTVGWLAAGCFLFATTDGRLLALIAVHAIVFEHFPEGVDVADVAASAVEKVSDRGPNDTAAAESALAAVVCCGCCCCGCSCCDDRGGPADEEQFLLSSQISLLLLSFSRFLELAVCFLLLCSAVAAEEFNSLQVKLMLLPPLLTSSPALPTCHSPDSHRIMREPGKQ
jgi:hypothetical protein